MERNHYRNRLALGFVLTLILALGLSFFGCGKGNEEGSTDAVESLTEATETETEPSEPMKSVKDMVLYWNVDRDTYAYKSETGMSSRPVDKEDGMYHFLFATTEERQVSRRTASPQIKNRVDELRLMTLTFDEKGLITGCEDAKHATGGFFAEGYYVASYENGILRTYSASDLRGECEEIRITPDLPVYDCSGKGLVVGERAKEEAFVHFARVLGVLDFDGSLAYLYIIDRPAEYKLYWNVTRKYDAATMTSTRTPDDDGVYSIELSMNGETGIYYCKDQAVVNEMDKAWPKVFGLEFDEEGFITGYIDGPTAANATKVSSWHTVMELGDDGAGKVLITTESKVPSAGDFGQVKSWSLDPACKIFDTTGATGDVGCYTDVKVGDLVFLYREKTGFINYIYVVGNRQYEPEIADHHRCPECGKDVDWYKWGADKMLPTTEGHYFLDTDVTVDQQNVGENQHVVLCLNGHTVTGIGSRVYSLHYPGARLDIMDQEGGGSIVSKKEGDYAKTQGCIVWVRYGQFRLYSGTLDASGVKTGGTGAAVTSNKDTFFGVYGGKIIGGTSPYGGAIRVNGGSTFTMTGGTVVGGVSTERPEASAIDVTPGEGAVTLTGGSVSGGVWIKGRKSVTVGGYFSVSGGKGLYLPNGQTVTLPGTAKGRVSVTLENGTGLFTDNYAAGSETAFVSADSRYKVYVMSGALAINETNPHSHCVCGGSLSGHSHETETWFPWTKTDALPTANGNYYLTKDVKLTIVQQITKAAKVKLCLNGHTVTGDGFRMYTTFDENTALTLTDCKDTGVLRPTGAFDKQGQGFWVRYGTFTMYAGTIDGSKTSGSNYGPLYVGETGQAVLYGGKIIGGEVLSGGGAIYTIGPVVMNGGTVTGGKSVTGQGGAVFLNGDKAAFTMNGGTIDGGEARVGGAVSVQRGVFTLNGGTVQNGKAVRVEGTGGHAGNFYVGIATLTVNGGEIRGGSTTNIGGAAISANHKNSVVKVNGGTIDGDIRLWNDEEVMMEVTGGTIGTDGKMGIAFATGILRISGTPVINQVYFASGKTAEIGTLSEGAKIGVTMKDVEGVFGTDAESDASAYFESTVAGLPITYRSESKTMFLGREPHVHCVCGGTGTSADGHTCEESTVWKAWTSADSLPKESGYYYLTEDVTLSVNTSPANGSEVYLCLNGHTVTQGTEGMRIIQLNGNGTEAEKARKYTITNCGSREDGKVVGKWTGEYATQGGVFWINDNPGNAFTFYNLTIDASANNGSGIGSAISLLTGSLKVFNTTILGGTSRTASLGGGSVYIKGTAEFHSCTFTGGKAPSANGGILFADGNTTTVTIEDSEFTGGEARIGGNIAVMAAAVTIRNSSITGGSAKRVDGSGGHSGNVYLSSGTLEISDSEIKDGHITNISCSENFSMNHRNGAALLKNVTVNGGVLLWNEDGKLTVDGGTYTDGGASSPGIRIQTGTLTLTGDPVVERLYLVSGKTIAAESLEDSARITVELESGTGLLAENVASDLSALFTDVNGEAVSYDEEGKQLFIGHYHCVCSGSGSHTHEAVAWTKWESTNSLPKTAGYYYLTEDVTVTGNTNPANGAAVYLCLNGHTVRQATAGARVIQMNGNGSAAAKKYVITNCGSREDGRIVGNWTGSNAKQGGILWSTDNDGNTFELYNLTLDGAANIASGAGGVISMTKGSFTAYSVTVLGGTTTTGATGGGSIAILSGASAFYDSSITGGRATNGYGGNVYISGGSLLLKNTTVSGGSAAKGGDDIYETASGLVTVETE